MIRSHLRDLNSRPTVYETVSLGGPHVSASDIDPINLPLGTTSTIGLRSTINLPGCGQGGPYASPGAASVHNDERKAEGRGALKT